MIIAYFEQMCNYCVPAFFFTFHKFGISAGRPAAGGRAPSSCRPPAMCRSIPIPIIWNPSTLPSINQLQIRDGGYLLGCDSHGTGLRRIEDIVEPPEKGRILFYNLVGVDTDLGKGMNPAVPANYFPDDNPENPPIVNWRSTGQLLYSNWLNYYVYQTRDCGA